MAKKPVELTIEIKITFDEERLRDIFENAEIKFSQAKLKKLKEIIEECQYELDEMLEDALEGFINDAIQEEWER
jgi:hypothetical protein